MKEKLDKHPEQCQVDAFVIQRTDCDCMVACLAMLLEISYEESAGYFPPKAVEETGYRWEWLAPYLRRCGILMTHYPEQLIDQVDWSKPAMVDVPSLTAPEKGDHIIYWDGNRVLDPSNKYVDLPGVIFSVVQKAV